MIENVFAASFSLLSRIGGTSDSFRRNDWYFRVINCDELLRTFGSVIISGKRGVGFSSSRSAFGFASTLLPTLVKYEAHSTSTRECLMKCHSLHN